MSDAYQGLKRGNLVAANIELEILDTDSLAVPPTKLGRILLAGTPIFTEVVQSTPPLGKYGVEWDHKAKTIVRVPIRNNTPSVEWARHHLLEAFGRRLQEVLNEPE